MLHVRLHGFTSYRKHAKNYCNDACIFFKHYVVLKLSVLPLNDRTFVPISPVVKPVMLALLMRGRYNEAPCNTVCLCVC
jgi:hypothetical protein